MPTQKKLIVIGGGAAGFFCAIAAAQSNPNLKIILLEKSIHLLSKVKISGGGRCNVTHACGSISELIKNYPRGSSFLKKSFQHFFVSDTIAWFAQRGVELKTESDGRMFPTSNISQTIVDCLMNEAQKYGVDIRLQVGVKQISKSQSDSNFILTLNNETELTTDFLCVACGGFPKIEQFSWLKSLNHNIEPPLPSLFTFNLRDKKLTELMGVATENTTIRIAKTKFEYTGSTLITHWGLSGPAVLKLSAFAARWLHTQEYRYTVIVNWASEFNDNTLLKQLQTWRFELASQKISNRNPLNLPLRLWEYLLKEVNIDLDMRWADLPSKQQNKLSQIVCSMVLECQGKTTFKDEFVTSGGVDLDHVEPNTMESKLMPKLFFAGEILNIDGITGGFNFQNAWTTGFIAGKTIGENAKNQ